MRKVLLVITPTKEYDVQKGVNTVLNLMKDLGIKDYEISVTRSVSNFELPKFLTEKYNVYKFDFVKAVNEFDDVYILEEGVENYNGSNSLTFTVFNRVLEKTNMINYNDRLVKLSSLKELLIEDFIGDAFLVKNDHNEIQKFINAYLDNIQIGSETPEQSEMVKKAKIGLNILLNKLQGINQS